MKPIFKGLGGVVGLIFLALVVASLFVIREGEQAIVRRFGRPVGNVRYPGLHVKLPFIDEIVRFESRILKWDGDPNQVPTRERKYIWVDSTARWRINNPLEFLRSVVTIHGAINKLDDIIDSVVRDAVSANYLVDLVRGDTYTPPEDETFIIEEDVEGAGRITRESIIQGAFEQAELALKEYGIELVDLQIKRINYVEEVRKLVYTRMISERNRIATQYRSEGEGEHARILGNMERELMRIRSEAYRTSVEIRGDADAKAASIYAQAFGEDPEFYSFYRSMEALENSVNDNSSLLLSTDSDFFKYLKTAQQ